jgi:hypothetical protein
LGLSEKKTKNDIKEKLKTELNLRRCRKNENRKRKIEKGKSKKENRKRKIEKG